MFCIYSNDDVNGVEVETAEEAWKILRSKDIINVPTIAVKIVRDGQAMFFDAATWYSILYTGVDTAYDLDEDVIQEYIAGVDALREVYPVERKQSELTVIGRRDMVFRNHSDSLESILDD